MKTIIFISFILTVSAADRYNTNNYVQQQRPTSPPPQIVRISNNNPGDGKYDFGFETENRITHQEIGEVKNQGTDQETNVIQGSYSFEGLDGITYTVNYIADENGFRASGDHIPTAAPIPAEIQEAVRQNDAEEAAGYVDDGQYRPDEQEQPRKFSKEPQRSFNRY